MRIVIFSLAFPLLAAAAHAAPTDTDRRQFALAHKAAVSAPAGAWRPLARGLEDYPLYAYLEYAALTRDLKAVAPSAIAAFLKQHDGTVLAEQLRARWLAHLVEQRRWREVVAFHAPSDELERRCGHASARAALGDVATLEPDARALWLTPRSLPRSCDGVLGWLRRQRGFDANLVWQRIELAATARETGLIAQLAPLTGPGTTEAKRWAATIANPSAELAKAVAWPDDARHRRLVALATAQLARRDAARAGHLWPALEQRFKLAPSDHGAVLDTIALYKAASYEPDAALWIAKLPPTDRSDELREWTVREALARRDHAAAEQALDALPEPQRDDPRWRYVRARILDETRRGTQALPLYEALAREANYHGFLAAEKLGAPYSVCPDDASVAPPDAAMVAANPSLARAFELHALGWLPEARREWQHALRGATDPFRRAAVAAAHAHGWVERGPLTLLAPQDLRYYTLRFPIAYEREIRAAAKRHGLDPALVLALIRSESAWATDAASSANAHGLMQLLPGAARQIAKRERVPFRGVRELYDPQLNIRLGTHHLAQDLARYGGKVWLAAAAYNAGPTPVQRWTAARGTLPPDLFVETIPYRETREYVARVIAFSVVYDWRLNGDAASLTDRITVASKANGRRPVVCPLPKVGAP